MMTPKKILIILTIIILVLGIFLFNGLTKKVIATRFKGEGFSFQLYRNIKVNKLPSKMDFDIYQFKMSTQLILSAFVGNYPSPGFNEMKNVVKGKGKINKLPYESYYIKHSNGTESKEYIILLRTDNWPVYIHYWYYKLSKPKARVAEEIISSTLNH